MRMAESNGYLSRGQKIQLKAIAAALLLETLIYGIFVTLNGFNYTHQLIQENLLPVLFFSLSIFAIAPVYHKTDDTTRKIIKQLTFSGVILVTISIPTWIYYRFNPPSTGWERLVDRLTYIYTSASILKVAASYAYKERTSKATPS